MSALDRFSVCSFAAVGSASFINDRLPSYASGMTITASTNGNWEASILADNFGEGNYGDVTSLFTGAATFKTGGIFARADGFLPYGLRIQVTSIQSAKFVNFAVGVC